MEQEVTDYIQALKEEVERTKSENLQLRNSSSTIFSGENNDNLIKWQLDIKEEIQRIERLLRKQVPKRDQAGNEYFENSSVANQLFNEIGIQEVLNVLAWYLNKNIILSNFSETDIKMRVHQFSTTITDFIFNNYQRFGLDDQEKIKHFPIIIMNIVNTIEAAYLRALHGGERESLRTARTVTQSEPLGGGFGGIPSSKKKFSFFKPTTWS